MVHGKIYIGFRIFGINFSVLENPFYIVKSSAWEVGREAGFEF